MQTQWSTALACGHLNGRVLLTEPADVGTWRTHLRRNGQRQTSRMSVRLVGHSSDNSDIHPIRRSDYSYIRPISRADPEPL